jgi:hypothetical protein
MKTFAYLAGVSLAVALAGLVSGCATTPHQAQRVEPVRDFEVVENSANRPLTDKELAEVRASVASYLDREGATDSGDYYLKVFLTPQNADGDPDWVVVRFTRYTAERVVLVGDYGYADAYYVPYYSYDLYPYGYYDGIARISFQYYVDPYYGHHYPYYPHHGSGGGHDDHHHDTANNHDGKPGNPPGNGNDQGARPPPKYYGNRPGIPQNQNHAPPRTGDTAQTDQRNGSPRQGGGRADGRTHASDPANSDKRPVPPRPVQTAATDQASRPAYTAPARTANPVRTEARVEPSSNRSAPVYRPAPSAQPAHVSQPAPERSSTSASSGGKVDSVHQEAAR